MKDLKIITKSEQQTMSSREIAEYTGKRHSDVLEAIRAMEPAWEGVCQRKFSLTFTITNLPNGGTRKDPMYQLSKTECLYVATKFNDEARARLILRWEQLEKANKMALPQTFAEALRLAAEQAEQIEQQQKALQESQAYVALQNKVLASQKPKVVLADAITQSQDSILIRELAVILNQNGTDIGERRLYTWMRDNGFICRFGRSKNQPTQKGMNLGLFEIRKRPVTLKDGREKICSTTMVTGEGQKYFINRFNK